VTAERATAIRLGIPNELNVSVQAEGRDLYVMGIN
jgi:hypothetical protein